jgi:hypothetical protein
MALAKVETGEHVFDLGASIFIKESHQEIIQDIISKIIPAYEY